jgi:hypothetical protein
MRYSRLQNSDTHMINIGMSPAHELKMELNYPQQRVKCQWKWGEVPYSHRYGQYLEHSHPQCGCLPSSFYLFWLGRMMSPTSFTHLYPNFARWKKKHTIKWVFFNRVSSPCRSSYSHRWLFDHIGPCQPSFQHRWDASQSSRSQCQSDRLVRGRRFGMW